MTFKKRFMIHCSLIVPIILVAFAVKMMTNFLFIKTRPRKRKVIFHKTPGGVIFHNAPSKEDIARSGFTPRPKHIVLARKEKIKHIENMRAEGEVETPTYTIIYKIEMSIGGKHAAVIVPSISRDDSRKKRKHVAYAILRREGVKSIDIYNSKKAYNRVCAWMPKKSNGRIDVAAYKKEMNNPTPVRGWIGRINRDGQYYDNYRLQYQ